MSLETLAIIATIAFAGMGMTWKVGKELRDIVVELREIKSALTKHVDEDKVLHAGHEARIIKLESRRRK